MRRAVSPLRGEARPRKRFCPPRTRSPHLNLSQPPFEAWCADLVHPHFYSGWQMGDAFVFPPLQLIHSPPVSRMIGDTAVSLLQCTEPVPATRQPSTSLSIILNKDAEGSPSRWRVPLLPGLLDTPSQVCLPLHDTLIPLSHFLHEWKRLPGVSLWVLRTIRSGYTLQFGKESHRFDGVHLTVVNSASKSSVLQQELSSLLQKGAIEEVPQSEVERGFFSRYFLAPKRDGGLRPILDLRRFNFSLYKGKFKMLTIKTIMSQVQEGDWFVTIDLKDAYFHIQVVRRHRRFLRFAFGGKAYQYKVLPFGLALAPRTFTKCMDAGSLQGASESSQGYRSQPHPFSWPQDERQEECAPPISVNRVSRGSFGFRSDAGPFGSCPDIRSYSMSGPLQARPSCLCRYLPQAVGPHGSGLPCVAPRVASHEAIPLVDEGAEVTPHCTSYSPYQGVAQLLSTPFNVARPRFSPERGENGCDPPSPYDHDGSINDRLGHGLRRQTGEWGVEGRVPLLAYKLPGTQGCLPGFEVFSPRSRGYHIIVRTDNMAVVSHINRQGGSRSRTLDRLARRLPLWSQDKFLSLRGGSCSGSTEPGGRFSVETEAQAGGMDVEPSDGIPDLGSVWQSGGGPLCFSRVISVPALVLPEFPDDSGHRCVRPPMAECQSVCVYTNKADSSSTMQSEGERCPHSPILALPDLILGANSPLVSAYLGDSDQAGLTVPASGQDLASSTRALEVVGMAHTGPRAVIDGLPAEVQETIASARAPATRKLYSSKWGVFESWCLTCAIDPVNCPVGPVLEFLQERLTAGAAATTLRVYVAAIAARRELDEIPLGRHRMVSAFMRGVRHLRPVRPTAVPSWDLSVVLEGLVTAPFEHIESASEWILTLKFVLLLALTSLKRVGDLQAFSVSETCMGFAPGLVKVTLRPRPGYIPKVLSTPFRSQVVTLHSFHPPPFASSEDERLHMLCPVRALKLYVDRSKVWRKSPQLLICFGAGRRGLATSKQRIFHWVRDAISLAYEALKLPSPLSLRAQPPLKLFLEGYPWRIFVLRQDGPLRTPLSGFTTLTLIRLQVLRSCLFEPTVRCWFIILPDRQRFSAWRVWYIVPEAVNAALSSPIKENVSGYSRNPCSLNILRDAAYTAKLLTLPTGFFSTEKSEEWMARSPV